MSRTLTTAATGRFLHRTGWASRHSEIRRRRQAFFGGRSRCQSRGPPRCYQRLAGGRSVCYQRWRAISSGRQPILCHGTRTRGRASPPREHNPRRSQGHVSHAHRYQKVGAHVPRPHLALWISWQKTASLSIQPLFLLEALLYRLDHHLICLDDQGANVATVLTVIFLACISSGLIVQIRAAADRADLRQRL